MPAVLRAEAPAERTDLSWSVLLDPPLDGARNMARDHALAAGLIAGAAVLRIYGWSIPTLSFGRNEPVRDLRGRLEALGGVSFVRRPTGGRTVLHDRELTYAVVVPLRALGGIRQAYRRVNEGLVSALLSLGVPADLGGARKTAPPGAGPCFREAAGDEVTVDGRKLVGSAQVRIEGALLQHGSILLAEDQSRLDAVWPDESAVAPPPASLAEILGTIPPWERMTEAIVGGMREVLEGTWSAPLARVSSGPSPSSARTRDGAADLRQVDDQALGEHLLGLYRSHSWTWRR
jgi:lipoate-protein ligase A